MAALLRDAFVADMIDKGTPIPAGAAEDLFLVLELCFTKGYQAGCLACIRDAAPSRLKV
jgi:hypothetical protein